MEEYREMMELEMPRVVVGKWMKALYLLQIVSLVTVPLALIPKADIFLDWVNLAWSVATVVIIHRLSSANPRYQKAALYFLIGAVGALLQQIAGSNLLTSAAGICGIVAAYQEYHGHSELVAEVDAKLAGKWTSLFYWELVLGAVGGFGAMAAVLIGTVGGMEEAGIVALGVAVVLLVDIPLSVMKLFYLKKMKCYFPE